MPNPVERDQEINDNDYAMATATDLRSTGTKIWEDASKKLTERATRKRKEKSEEKEKVKNVHFQLINDISLINTLT